MPNQNLPPVSKEEYERWRSDVVTQTLLYTLVDSVGNTKEELSVRDRDQTLEDVRYAQGWINAALQVLDWSPIFEENIDA